MREIWTCHRQISADAAAGYGFSTGAQFARFQQKTGRKLPGVRYECFGVFTEFVPNKRIVGRWSLAIEESETYTFDTEGSGTRLTIQARPRSLWIRSRKGNPTEAGTGRCRPVRADDLPGSTG